MTQNEFDQLIDQHFKDRQDERYVRNLSATLAKLIHLPLDHSLVAVLGKGDETDNADALQTWVAKELKSCRLDQGDPLDYLYARILSDLADKLNGPLGS